MSTSTRKLIFLLFLPILTAEKCPGTKSRSLKRNASTITASKTAAAADTVPLTDLTTTEEQPDGQQKEKKDKNDQVGTKVKAAIAVQEAKNTENGQESQAGEGGAVLETEAEKPVTNLDDSAHDSNLTGTTTCNHASSTKVRKPGGIQKRIGQIWSAITNLGNNQDKNKP